MKKVLSPPHWLFIQYFGKMPKVGPKLQKFSIHFLCISVCLFVLFLLLFLNCIEKIQISSLIFPKQQEIVINIYILIPLLIFMKNKLIVYGSIRTASHLSENSSLLPCAHSEESGLVTSVAQELQYQAPYFVFYSLLSLGIITDRLPFEDGSQLPTNWQFPIHLRTKYLWIQSRRKECLHFYTKLFHLHLLKTAAFVKGEWCKFPLLLTGLDYNLSVPPMKRKTIHFLPLHKLLWGSCNYYSSYFPAAVVEWWEMAVWNWGWSGLWKYICRFSKELMFLT